MPPAVGVDEDAEQFNFMQLSEQQMQQHLQELLSANERSIERHLAVKA